MSSSVRHLIVQRIRERGPLTVAEFMSIALYHPEHGYYARAARRTGRNGDFFTSVDVGPAFGAMLARQFEEMWQRLERDGSFDLVEAGASNGQLARDVLDAARATNPDFYSAIRLHLVDASPAARAAQREMLAPHADKVASSGATLPDSVHGVIYANELLDALPVHSVVMTEHGLREHYVDVRDDELVERLGAPSTEALERHLASVGVSLKTGARAEVNLAAMAWTTRACLSLHHGFLLLVDYGHPAEEIYSATQPDGTLTTFARHVADPSAEGPAGLQAPGQPRTTVHGDLAA